MTAIAPNPHSPYATADPNSRHLLPGFFGEPKPGHLIPTGCNRLAVVPEEPLSTVDRSGDSFPPGICELCIEGWYASHRGEGLPESRPLTDCRECDSITHHDGLCALCRQEKHDEWWPTRDALENKEPTT